MATEPPTTTQQPNDTSDTTSMSPPLTPLPNFRIPGYPTTPIHLAGTPLTLISTTAPLPPNTHIPIPAAIATILHAWHPSALAAFLDLDAHFSLTWTLTLPTHVLEIGRVGTQVTFGSLDASGSSWTLMLSYAISPPAGRWVPVERESMRGDVVLSAAEIDSAAQTFLADALRSRCWEAPKGKGAKHAFAVEYAPMDPFSDGIPMSPHWLYKALDLGTCTTCGVESGVAQLQRCGRCGMAAYCGAECQRGDWAVHKALCGMGAVERGTAVRISMDGGLIAWDVERRFGEVEEESENPHFGEKVMKRTRVDDALVR